ncbi:DUF7539 family protein [Natrialba asiatica]|uniref:Uncharacterized protein n=1 Tax=Natrialba asiatica (strain ATCC 700177 / DSM 12278 / JCM 9576 / FERM P-10747 / NBRC 102637 / 172P1) TaxID=29540 RepID=M0B5K5_NATA1|nr:hypothetical protein C481_02327 [Natrialba asiatica DSM 12278]
MLNRTVRGQYCSPRAEFEFGGKLDTDTPLVVCTYHPEIPDQEYRGAASLDEATRETFNEVLWEYYERVAGCIQSELEAFLEFT